MGIAQRIAKIEDRLERQEVNRLIALPVEEVILLLPDRSKRVHSLYLNALSNEKLIELARLVFRLCAAYDLGISEEELSEEQFQAWCSENYPEPGEGPGRIGPNFNCD